MEYVFLKILFKPIFYGIFLSYFLAYVSERKACFILCFNEQEIEIYL